MGVSEDFESTHSGVGSLLARAKAGDADAFEELFRRCRAYLIVFARARSPEWLQAKVDASDIVQETLLVAHHEFAQFRGQTSAKWLAWLRAVLENQNAAAVRHYVGTQKRDLCCERPLHAPSPGDSSGSFSSLLARRETPSRMLISR